MEPATETSHKRSRQVVPPESGKKQKTDPAHQIRNNVRTAAMLDQHHGIFKAAGVWGFVQMDQRFSIEEAEEVEKGLTHVGMTP
ncbi:unnamed protein product [Calypogeia fissa]